jgi:hypothetical protein
LTDFIAQFGFPTLVGKTESNSSIISDLPTFSKESSRNGSSTPPTILQWEVGLGVDDNRRNKKDSATSDPAFSLFITCVFLLNLLLNNPAFNQPKTNFL